jgi:hypothetical protein
VLDVRGTIEKHGWAVPVVLDDGPGDPPFAYSIGLHGRGLPEVLVVGPCTTHAGALVQHVASVLAAGRATPRAGTVVDLPPKLPWARIRLGAVQPHWARRFVIQADAHYGQDVAVLQIIAPDGAGRGPDHDEVDLALLERQPVLSEPDRPWLLPVGRRLLTMLEDERPVDASFALLPILAPDGPIGREELVPAVPLSDGSWAVASQPALADWCPVGTRIEADAVTTRCPLTRGLGRVVRYRRVVRRSHWVPHRWTWYGSSEREADRLEEALTAPTRHPHPRVMGVSAMPHAVTVAVEPRHAPSLRSAMRRLERDGLVAPRSLFHRAEDPDLAPRDPRCPCCATKVGR